MAHGGGAYPSGAVAAAASGGGFTARPTGGGGAIPTDLNLNRIALEYPYADLAAATENFSPKYRLGQGSYGSVYKCQLKDQTEVAIKVLRAPKESGFREEVEVLSKFRHPNLVILMGFARNGNERLLIYELLEGGDLCSRLSAPNSAKTFPWTLRVSVALDACLGLSHLHNSTPKVFHRDIKSQNIILDKSGNAKVADFGLALLATAKGRDGQKVDMCSGTIGYADPLYISTSVVTEKSEVYSFGMVLLELLTTKPPALQDPRTKAITEMYKGINKEKLWNMIQWSCGWHPAIASELADLALRCIDSRESRRPVFVEVAKALRELKRKSQTIALQQQQQQPAGSLYAGAPPPPPPPPDMRNNVFAGYGPNSPMVMQGPSPPPQGFMSGYPPPNYVNQRIMGGPPPPPPGAFPNRQGSFGGKGGHGAGPGYGGPSNVFTPMPPPGGVPYGGSPTPSAAALMGQNEALQKKLHSLTRGGNLDYQQKSGAYPQPPPRPGPVNNVEWPAPNNFNDAWPGAPPPNHDKRRRRKGGGNRHPSGDSAGASASWRGGPRRDYPAEPPHSSPPPPPPSGGVGSRSTNPFAGPVVDGPTDLLTGEMPPPNSVSSGHRTYRNVPQEHSEPCLPRPQESPTPPPPTRSPPLPPPPPPPPVVDNDALQQGANAVANLDAELGEMAGQTMPTTGGGDNEEVLDYLFSGPNGEDRARIKKEEEERKNTMAELASIGFPEDQIEEAVKKHPTLEDATNWILDNY
ncbi:hypothetical protein FOL46_007571 [Perkinsus olseni]|uniref:Protein kinase domain-containing protein n=1 Tax=Perkinsus olseni TaxID=32597 RepID=A0A7J6LDC5_PEROL|nr:hypothetical protein FOL46_007571 [Perkinsus olseni]